MNRIPWQCPGILPSTGSPQQPNWPLSWDYGAEGMNHLKPREAQSHLQRTGQRWPATTVNKVHWFRHHSGYLFWPSPAADPFIPWFWFQSKNSPCYPYIKEARTLSAPMPPLFSLVGSPNLKAHLWQLHSVKFINTLTPEHFHSSWLGALPYYSLSQTFLWWLIWEENRKIPKVFPTLLQQLEFIVSSMIRQRLFCFGCKTVHFASFPNFA